MLHHYPFVTLSYHMLRDTLLPIRFYPYPLCYPLVAVYLISPHPPHPSIYSVQSPATHSLIHRPHHIIISYILLPLATPVYYNLSYSLFMFIYSLPFMFLVQFAFLFSLFMFMFISFTLCSLNQTKPNPTQPTPPRLARYPNLSAELLSPHCIITTSLSQCRLQCILHDADYVRIYSLLVYVYVYMYYTLRAYMDMR